ncbi:hypothetical protein AAC978_07135 [Desulfitobacterium sp. THU1]|uniref:hypothetical protein n=1 Tax=Desulfitobacterium sp. THU1 TaxID=3138072 RepID=UPI00311EF23A
MHFNLRYGRTGIVAMPYFLTFERTLHRNVFALLRKPKGWDKVERKGFASTGTTLEG